MILPLKFNTLSKTDQAELLQLEGVYFSTRHQNDLVIDRYWLHNFFVDVISDAGTDDVQAIQSFYPQKQKQSPIYQMHLPRLSVRAGA